MSTFMDIYKDTACVAMDVCVTCLAVCREHQLQPLAEDTMVLLKQLLYDIDLDSCLKLLRPNKKLNLCSSCHKILSDASLFREKALKSLLQLQKKWRPSWSQENIQSTPKAQVENTLTNKKVDIKVVIEPYLLDRRKIEPDPLETEQSAVFTHKPPESIDLPIDIKQEYDSDDCALSELRSVLSKDKIVPKKEIIETDIEDNIASTLLTKGSKNLELGSKKLRVFSRNSQSCSNEVKLKLIAPIFETCQRQPIKASKTCDQIQSMPVEKVTTTPVKPVKNINYTPVKPVKKSKTLPATDQTMILSETESECDSQPEDTEGAQGRLRRLTRRKKWYITVVPREQLLKKREENLKDPKYISAVYKCEYCAVPFEEQAFHYYHEQACHAKKAEDGTFTCFVCGCSFKALIQLTAHARFHSAGCHAFQCATCGYTTTENCLVARHQCPNKGGDTVPPKDPLMVLTKARRQYYCPECDYVSHYRPVDAHYVRSHKNICQVKCELCGKTSRTKYIHKEHVRDVHERPKTKPKPTPAEREEVMFCAPCVKPFYSMIEYRAHMQTLKHTPKDQIRLKCDECPRMFHLRRLLEEHKKMHELERTGQKPYKCNECGVAYFRKKSLQQHVRKHEQAGQEIARNHVCDVCGSAFTTAQILREHLNKHSDERPYKCEYCGDTFKYSGARYTHIKLKHKKKKTKPDDQNKGTRKSARNRKRSKEKGDEHVQSVETNERAQGIETHEQRIKTHEHERSIETKEHEQSMETDEHKESMGLSDYGRNMEPLEGYDQMLALETFEKGMEF